ncbi:phytanoyl-CoA dioxygenase [Aureococcus anophagefferens]|uniref:Phytanoyl-CoA dioxygenase n=1 Tax=Aureococcus anophagefferens TaxID=44056 RepID=A0ABR1GE88_AURAN
MSKAKDESTEAYPPMQDIYYIQGYLYKKTRDGRWRAPARARGPGARAAAAAPAAPPRARARRRQKRWFETTGCFLTYYKSKKMTKLLAALNLPQAPGPASSALGSARPRSTRAPQVGEIKLVTDPAGEDAEDKGKLFSIHLNDRDYLLKAVGRRRGARAGPGGGRRAAPADAGDACAPPSQLSSALMDRAWAAAVAKLALAEVDDCEPSLLADALRHLVVAGGLAGEAPFGDVFGTPLEVCEESGDEAAAAAVRRYAGGARTSLDADDVADFALLRRARAARRRRRRRRATTATGRRGRVKRRCVYIKTSLQTAEKIISRVEKNDKYTVRARRAPPQGGLELAIDFEAADGDVDARLAELVAGAPISLVPSCGGVELAAEADGADRDALALAHDCAVPLLPAFALDDATARPSRPLEALPWHADGQHPLAADAWPEAWPERPNALCAFLPLVDLDDATGYTTFWPGSHRVPQRESLAHDLPTATPWATVPGKLAAGDALLYDYSVVHRGEANATEHTLRGIVYLIYANEAFVDSGNFVEATLPA